MTAREQAVVVREALPRRARRWQVDDKTHGIVDYVSAESSFQADRTDRGHAALDALVARVEELERQKDEIAESWEKHLREDYVMASTHTAIVAEVAAKVTALEAALRELHQAVSDKESLYEMLDIDRPSPEECRRIEKRQEDAWEQADQLLAALGEDKT